ncbi:MAG: hypothetical protein HY842_01575 [Bacteroidetes bacterium]|nr:hypothetical protein [Bacteroidota bacterium]
MKKLLIFLSVALWATTGHAQRSRVYQEVRSNDGSLILFNFSYGGHLPGGDLGDRFGGNYSAGLGGDFFTKNNWVVGLHSNFYFGKEVKTDVLANLRSNEGFIYADDGGVSDIQLRERGLYIGGHLGKIFPVSENNRRSGIRVTVGGGFLQHKIRIQDEPQVFVSPLDKEYKKGYDRLTNGFALTEFIGYQFLANNRLVNFMIGLEFAQGFTANRRSFNFDTRSVDSGNRLDLLYGFRLGWTLPLYIGENPDLIKY